MQETLDDNAELDAEKLSEVRKRFAGAAVSKVVASAIGDMVTLYSRDPAHRHFSFADIEWKILPSIVNGQYHIETADDPEFGTLRPIALVTWAKVSDELDERLSAQVQGELVRLRPQEWTSGEHSWLVDVVGTPEGVRQALKKTHENQFSEVNAKVPTRNKDGKLEITFLSDLVKVMEDQA